MSAPSIYEVGTLVTAVCALVTTVWQAAISRKHNRLSVRPVLTLYRKEIDGVIYVKNNGSGPAIIKEYEVWKDGKLTDEKDWPTLLPFAHEAPDLTVGSAIAVGEKIDLMKSVTYLDNSHVGPLQSLNFRVVYESIYGQRWTLE